MTPLRLAFLALAVWGALSFAECDGPTEALHQVQTSAITEQKRPNAINPSPVEGPDTPDPHPKFQNPAAFDRPMRVFPKPNPWFLSWPGLLLERVQRQPSGARVGAPDRLSWIPWISEISAAAAVSNTPVNED